MNDKQTFHFPGEQIDVEWDGRLCIHIAECGKSKDVLFEGGRKPWCDPDLASIDYVKEVVVWCPTGALTWTTKSIQSIENTATRRSVLRATNFPFE